MNVREVGRKVPGFGYKVRRSDTKSDSCGLNPKGVCKQPKCYTLCWSYMGPEFRSGQVGSGQVGSGSGFVQMWLQQAGHCADSSFVSRFLVTVKGSL